MYGCLTWDDVDRSIWLIPGSKIEDTMTVVAKLVVLRHEASVAADGSRFAEFTENRLVGRVRP